MPRKRLTLDEFCRIVGEVVAELPDPFQSWLENVAIDVEAGPSQRLLREMDLDPAEDDLFGVFDGKEVTEQEYGERYPNRIVIFQRPLERACRSRAELVYEIRRTVIHELAHHFGYSEEDLEDFESRESPFDEE